MERLSAGTHLVSSAEYLVRPTATESGSLGDWSIVRDRFEYLPSWRRRVLDIVSRPLATRTLHAGRILASAALLLPTGNRARAIANGYLTASSALLYPRHNFGSDGSDQVSLQTSAVAFIARTCTNEKTQDAAIWYLALQDTLAYAVSGWVKLFGPSWRAGTAVPGVMRTVTYGNKHVWRIFKDRPVLARLAGHGMLAFEGLFPLVLLGRGRLTRPFLAAAVGFHTFIAGSMGLGRFLTAFGSMLPAVAYVTNQRPKSKTVPVLAAATIGSALAAGAISGVARRNRIRKLRTHRRMVTTTAGNQLYFQWKRGLPGDPVLILDHGMISTPEHFAWLTEHLPVGTDVLTYWRAGYGPSTSATGAHTVDDAANDLVDLIASLPRTVGPIYLGGHSLGGLVARRAAQLTDRAIAGVIYLDSSHPGQFAISSHQRRGAEGFTHALSGVPATLMIGMGWLLKRPDWVDKLPEPVQRIALDQYRNSRMWNAGAKEWRAADRMFRQPRNTTLDSLDMPALVITAESTLRADTTQDKLHQDLADSHHRFAQRVIIRRADHDSILTSSAHAAAAAEAIGGFIKEVTPS